MNRRILGVGCLAILVACDSTSIPEVSQLSQVLVGPAAAARNARGEFILPGAPPSELQQSEAVALAVAYARSAGVWLRGAWEGDRGAAIEIQALRPCGRAFYAQNVLIEPGAGLGRGLRRLTSSHWLVTLCGGDNDPQVSIAIPAAIRTPRVMPGGIENIQDADITSFGIPLKIRGIPPSPEHVAETAAKLTGKRVRLVPELVLPVAPLVAQLARWRVTFDEPVTITDGQGIRRTTDELFFGFSNTWHQQVWQSGETTGNQYRAKDHDKGGNEVSLTIRSGYPDRFTPVTVEKN